MTSMPLPGLGSVVRIVNHDRRGKPTVLNWKVGTVVELDPPGRSKPSAAVWLHCSRLEAAAWRLPSRRVVVSLARECESVRSQDHLCPKCDKWAQGVRVFPDGAILFRHGGYGCLLECGELRGKARAPITHRAP